MKPNTKIILDTLASWGEGLRVEEIAAATGISELEVYAALKRSPAVEDRGELGWFFRKASPARRALRQGCPRCGAPAGEPCRGLGLVTTKGRAMVTVHAARKREPDYARRAAEAPRTTAPFLIC